MKEPTTQFSIALQSQIQINRDFLLSQGWLLKEEKPLFENFIHSREPDLYCAIGMYGEFAIEKLHWCNKTPERYFSTLNPRLTTDDYFKILSLLNILQ